jgi:ElaB/YqjD/DUF883 family membrane-anchored ribosome-binding protein
MTGEEREMLKGIERSKDKADSLVDRSHELVMKGSAAAERKVEEVADAVVQGTHSAAARVREGSKAASEGAHQRVEGAARALDRGFVKAQQDLAEVAERTSNYVASNPGRSLLIAAGIGFALGLFFRRNRDA